jgi:hypothetical protein
VLLATLGWIGRFVVTERAPYRRPLSQPYATT